jgi:Uma2 family endonuclease
MATATTTQTQPAVTTVEGDQCVTLRWIGWKGFRTVLRLRGDRPVPRMIYLDGNLLLVSPSFIHERLSVRLGMLVTVIVEELDICCNMAGSTMFLRRSKRGGFEADQTFYLANAERISGKTEIDLRVDPPPDLVIEAVHTHPVAEAIEVHRRLGVPEVWVCTAEKMRILVRQASGRYARSESSAAFPFLKATEIFTWVTKPGVPSDTQWLHELRRWVNDVLVPRRAGPQA